MNSQKLSVQIPLARVNRLRTCCAAVLIGGIAGLVRPFIRVSDPYGPLPQKRKVHRKITTGVNVLRDRSSRCSTRQRSKVIRRQKLPENDGYLALAHARRTASEPTAH